MTTFTRCPMKRCMMKITSCLLAIACTTPTLMTIRSKKTNWNSINNVIVTKSAREAVVATRLSHPHSSRFKRGVSVSSILLIPTVIRRDGKGRVRSYST